MTPDQFIAKWKAAELKERSAAQSHFIDLCHVLGEPAPTDVDPMGEWYAFERGATKTTGGEGWADVWKRDHFGWEYKGKRKDLMRKGVVIRTVINNMTFDGSTKDPMQRAVRDALIAFMAATA